MAIRVRRAHERGHGDHGWLDTWHTFSFSEYYDPRFMGFRVLRVINEDTVAPGGGFPTHGHRDMEIISYVLDGALEHKDSMGNGSVIRPGDVQRMTAGAGVTHSEYNASDAEPVHFLQIWIVPERRGLRPSYEQKTFGADEKTGRLRLVASQDGHEGSITIHADARLHAGLLGPGERARLPLGPDRHAWVQMARGRARVNCEELGPGDGLALSHEAAVEVEGLEAGEVLVFDLA